MVFNLRRDGLVLIVGFDETFDSPVIAFRTARCEAIAYFKKVRIRSNEKSEVMILLVGETGELFVTYSGLYLMLLRLLSVRMKFSTASSFSGTEVRSFSSSSRK